MKFGRLNATREFMMKTIQVVLLACALGFLPGTAALAQSGAIGVPGSAAGGVNPTPLTPPSHDLPSSVGPQGGSGIGGGSLGAESSGNSPGSSSRDLTPGTGKFETRGAPCIGSTGFGSSGVQPGHRC
jgi:hypothetical protein